MIFNKESKSEKKKKNTTIFTLAGEEWGRGLGMGFSSEQMEVRPKKK